MLSRLPIRLKLLLLGLVPVLGVVALSLMIYFDMQKQVASVAALGSMEDIADLSFRTDDVVNALQIERARVCLITGKKQALDAESARLLQATDSSIDRLNQFFNAHPIDRLPSALRRELAAAREQIKLLPMARTTFIGAANAANRGAQLTTGIDQYAAIDGSLVRSTAALGNLSDDGNLLRSISALVATMEVKERTSRTHALLSYVFAAKEFPPGSFKYFVELLTEEKVYAQALETNASDSQFQRVRDFAKRASRASTLAMQKDALETTEDAGFKTAADDWYRVQAENVNALHEVENTFVTDIRNAATSKRDQTNRAMRFTTLVSVTVALIALVLALLIRDGISRSIGALSDAARDVESKADFSIRAKKMSADDLGQLTDTFNHMLEHVQARDKELEAHRQNLQGLVDERTAALRQRTEELIEASRIAGKAEIATNVLHNVGNALNSVNTSATIVTEILDSSSVNSLADVVGLIDENKGHLGEFIANDSRGKLIPEYLSELSRVSEAERQSALSELRSLTEGLEHIKSVVRMQQGFAKKSSNVLENVHIRDLVDESLRLTEGAFARQGIELVCQFNDDLCAYVDRHKTIQILVNLMTNAKDAIASHGPLHPRIIISAWEADSKVFVRVTDNGLGIDAANLEKIFRFGFTTKASGHGFGLHSSATAAIEMGGHLRAYSDGLGFGASFEVDLQPPVPLPTATPSGNFERGSPAKTPITPTMTE